MLVKSKKIIIIGTTTNTRLAKWYFDNDTDYEVVAFSVNKDFITAASWLGLPVVPFENLEMYFSPSEYFAFVAIGYTKMNKIREKMYREVKAKGFELPNYISSKCSFLTQEQIGDNNLILEDKTIQPFVKIGSNNVFWSGNHIGHDTVIHNHIMITSHVVVSGYCEIKDNCFLGVNSTIHNEVVLEKETLVAAAAIIAKQTIEKGVYLPAQTSLFKKNSDEINF
jgi:sugar O-acyltransferase (sialic acid O-acetyltransferase NeuD family)